MGTKSPTVAGLAAAEASAMTSVDRLAARKAALAQSGRVPRAMRQAMALAGVMRRHDDALEHVAVQLAQAQHKLEAIRRERRALECQIVADEGWGGPADRLIRLRAVLAPHENEPHVFLTKRQIAKASYTNAWRERGHRGGQRNGQ